MDIPTTGALRQWFEAVLDRPATERHEWLTQHCADQRMRMRVGALLAAHAQTDAVLLDMPVAAVIDALRSEVETSEPEALIGTRIGAFRLLRVLGQGGMATVFLAEREGADFQQRVAVKLLRRGLYSAFEQRLFLRERQTLATLSHPAIARLIDGGVTDAGIPYLVMDYIDGVPITRYAADNRLDLRARLSLFSGVCRAVDAAHRQLVVHRDIKPSNILVTAAGEAKLLDFGIARLLDDNGEDTDADTALSALTPGYAAPEQYAGGPISTATDVYALGVLLHELVLGERPDHSRPVPSSVCASAADPIRWTIPGSRKALASALRGDIDSLLLKALAGEPGRRYASAGALADDIQRHLRHEPVVARTPTTAYRAQKFVQRHRGGVSVVAVLMLALATSLGTALWQAQVAHDQARRAQSQAFAAQREAQRANAVRDLLVQLFENERPGEARDAMPDTATLLQRGAARARSDLTTTPALQVEMLVVIARIYDQLSRFDSARPLLLQAVTVARRLPTEENDALGEALSQLGQLELSEKHYAQALPHLDEALSLQRGIAPRGLPVALTLHRRALIYSETDRHTEAIADYRQSLGIRETQLPPRHPLLIRSYGALGTAYLRAHRRAEATPWLRRALALARQVHGDVHVETARRLSNLGVLLHAMGRQEEAQRVLSEAVAIDRRVFAGPNSSIAPRLHNLGSTQFALGRLEEAEATLRESIAIERAVNSGDPPGVGFSVAVLARIQSLRGDQAGALALALHAGRILSATLPPGHARRLDNELLIARLRLRQPNPPDLRTYSEALRKRIDAQAHRDPELPAVAIYVQGLAYARAGDTAAALPLIEQALRMLEQQPGHRHDPPSWFVTLAQVREKLGDHVGAQRALRDGVAFVNARQMPPSHPARAQLAALPATGATPPLR